MKYFVKSFWRGIGVSTSILCFIAAITCFVLAAIGVLMIVLGGEITWEVPLTLTVAGVPLGAAAYAINEAL